MDLNQFLNQTDDEKIAFQDKISLVFMIMGAIFLGLIVLTLAMNALNFQQVEFESPFF